MTSVQNETALCIFHDIASDYDRWAQYLALFQYRHWRRVLLAALGPCDCKRVLDISTGTGAVAIDLARLGCEVTGLDISRSMLRRATDRINALELGNRISMVEGRAEDLPFAEDQFGAVTFTFLLRYVKDPYQPLEEIKRVLQPGGKAAMLEFGVPCSWIAAPAWRLYANHLLPVLSQLGPKGWDMVGPFLGPNISQFITRYPIPRLEQIWREVGFERVRTYEMSAGAAFVVTARRPA